MVNDKITLNFEIEKGEFIDPYYFSARIKLTNESKNLLREQLGSTVQFDNLDDHFNLNPENFYISYNQYGGRNELTVRDDNGRYLTSNLPLNHNGFSMELSPNGASIVDYGFYPLAVIYNPNHYDKAKEKEFDDHGKLLPTVSNILNKLLSNANNLTTQDVLQNVFLHLQKEAAKEIEKLEREREKERHMEEESNRKNGELKELIKNGEIKVFKVIKGHDIGNGRSAVILQLDGKGDEIVLDSNKYYIAEYKHHPEWEGDKYLHFVGPRDDMLLDYENLFFALNKSFYSNFESGFYSADSTDPYNYAKYSKEPYLSGDQLSEKLSNELEEDSNQIDAEVMFSDQPMNEEVTVKSEVKSRKKRAVEEDDNGETVSNLANIQARSEDKKITAVERQENSVLQKTAQKLFPNKDDIAVNDNLTADKNNLARLLHIAISKGNVNEAMRLIKQVGTDITYMGRSPLYFASEIGNFDMVKLLIEHGVTPNNRDALGSTPLIVAIGKGDVKIVEYLIKAGANVNLSDQYGNVPLDFAPGKNMEIAKLLIDEGASFNRVMHVASIVNDTELVKYLITKGVDVNCKSKIGDTPLHDAANRGNLDMVKLLLEYGAVPDSKNTINRTPLICAVSRGDTDIVKYLIEAGADVNTQMTDGYSLLHKAVIGGNLDMIKLLINKGAKLAVYNNCGDTPLAFAKQQGQIEIVNYMDSIISNLSHSKTISLDKTNINVKYDLAGNKLDTIEKSIKDAVQNFKGAFNTSGHDIKINAYIFNNRNDFKEYLKKVGFDAGSDVNGYTKMIDLSKGNAADVYIYLDSRGNFNQHTLEHEIGHAMHFANLGLSYILPKAMHEAIANYVAGLENGRHINDHGDKEALAEIRNKNLKPDEILRNDYQGKHYYSEAEQVVKFLEHKHPDLIDNLLKSLSTYGYHGRPQANKLVEDFLTELKGYDQEFKEWVKVQLSSKEHSQHKDMEVNQPTIDSNHDNQRSEQQGKSRQKREIVDEDEQETVMASVIKNMDKNSDIEAEISNSVANSQHPLKITMGEAIGDSKYKVELQATGEDIDNFYQNLISQCTAKKYTYDQKMIMYNKVYARGSSYDGELMILPEAYITNNHLFIKDHDFGTISDFNEMFYKSDEFM